MMLLDVAVKNLREAVRQPKNLAITLGLPVVFMLIFGAAFGDSDPEPLEVAVLNEDEGALGATYIENLAALAYGNGEPIVRLTHVASEDEGRDGLKAAGSFDAFVRVPANFTANLQPGEGPTEGPAVPVGQPAQGRPTPPPGSLVSVAGDPSKPSFTAASQVIAAYTQAFGEEATGMAPPVRVETSAVTAAESTQFDFIAPGLMVFAILNLAPQAASVLARESELRTIDRVRASGMRATSLLGGMLASQLVLATASMGLMLLTARLMGFHNQGTYLGAFVVVMGAAVAVLGMSLVIAAFARTQQEAANLGIMVSVPASFLSGAFFAIPSVDLFAWNGRVVGLYDLIPTTHAVQAMRDLMTFGATLDAVSGALAAMVALGTLWFAAGAILFGRRRLTAE